MYGETILFIAVITVASGLLWLASTINIAPAIEEIQFNDGCKIVYVQSYPGVDKQCCPYKGMEFCSEVR